MEKIKTPKIPKTNEHYPGLPLPPKYIHKGVTNTKARRYVFEVVIVDDCYLYPERYDYGYYGGVYGEESDISEIAGLVKDGFSKGEGTKIRFVGFEDKKGRRIRYHGKEKVSWKR